MGKRFGISVTDDGMLVEAAVVVKRGRAKISAIRRWESHSFLHNYLLFSRSIALGLPAYWLRQLPDDPDGLITGSAQGSFNVCTSLTEYDHYRETLRNNITAVYPEDAYLATIPRYFADAAPDSFIAIAAVSGAVKIGFVRDATIVAVFTAMPPNHAALEGFIGRIERFLRLHDATMPDFGTRYLLTDLDSCDPAEGYALRVSCGTDDIDVIKAAGCALCGTGAIVPRFSGPTPASRLRFLRTAITVGAVTAAAIAGLSIAALYAYNMKSASRIDYAKRSYQHILSNNAEIKNLIAEGDSISRKVIRIHKRLSQPTNWARFLDQLGTLRPEGLFIERLGSEQAQEGSSQMRIALGGWCETETVATEFIKALKKSPLLSGVTLSSLERISGQGTTCRFKIICVLSISNP